MTTVSSPRIFVLKIRGEYFLIRLNTKFSGFPNRNSKVSPTIGHPKLPGGSSLALLDLGLGLSAKMTMKTTASVRRIIGAVSETSGESSISISMADFSLLERERKEVWEILVEGDLCNEISWIYNIACKDISSFIKVMCGKIYLQKIYFTINL